MIERTLAVGMTTAQRKERYVFESIASFRNAGFEWRYTRTMYGWAVSRTGSIRLRGLHKM
jgi:hypothetical protein